MPRWAVVVCVLVVLLGMVGAVLGLAWADQEVRQWVERTAEHRLQRRLPQADSVEVTVDGFPFTVGVLLHDEVEGVHVHVEGFHHRGWELRDLSLDVEGIELDGEALLDEQRLVVTNIDSARIRGSIGASELGEVVEQWLEINRHGMWAHYRGERIEVTPKVDGQWIVLVPKGIAPRPSRELSLAELEMQRGPDPAMLRPMYYPLPMGGPMPCEPAFETSRNKLTLVCEIDGMTDELRKALDFG